MTGYGRGAVEAEGTRVIVEARSVNHRFLDLRLRGSSLSPEVEESVTGAVRRRIERGSVTLMVRIEQRGETAAVRIDREAARRVYAELSELRDQLGIGQPITLELICAQPGVMVTRMDDAGAERTAVCVLEAAARALDNLVRMRETEGATLSRDLEGRLSRLSELVDEVSEAAVQAPEDARRRLDERINRLMAATGLEAERERVAQEVAILADRLDVTEELVRLRSHLEHTEYLSADIKGSVGRRLEFLVQEMGREFNTISAKSQSVDISRAVVAAKAELEKLREQVQNIE
ncbi:YicC/YloC family endoribonuclease [Haliangium sp.]|uniref:YicC/YloC family endoribonuclease n=1 Tax=Haliangium sp. TaxID=2663208 RepID=UPI003D0FF8EF